MQSLLGAMSLCAPAGADALVYSAKPIEGWVIDAFDRRPIEGATVTANWQLEGGFDSGIPRGQLEILEAVTSATGRFQIPGWGPKIAVSGHASAKWPQLLFFKPGYDYVRLTRDSLPDFDAAAKSYRNDKRIPLVRSLNPEVYRSFNREIDWIGRSSGNECAWLKMPLTVRAIAAEDIRLASFGIRNVGSFVRTLTDNEDYFASKGCGSVKKFLEQIRAK
jgi:hypothetical protein